MSPENLRSIFESIADQLVSEHRHATCSQAARKLRKLAKQSQSISNKLGKHSGAKAKARLNRRWILANAIDPIIQPLLALQSCYRAQKAARRLDRLVDTGR